MVPSETWKRLETDYYAHHCEFEIEAFESNWHLPISNFKITLIHWENCLTGNNTFFDDIASIRILVGKAVDFA